MALTATISCTIDLIGDGWVTTPPENLGTPVVNTNSPGWLGPVQIQVGTTALLLPLNQSIAYLFVDPDVNGANAGMTLTLKGAVNDVGVGLSNRFMSLIPVSATTPSDPNNLGSTLVAVNQVYLNSTSPGSLGIGWL